ncbi:flagellar filament capping protein FliD [Aquifex aeolicus]|uniref:Flagellar hook-associated protein 2 n=1 Tax=Aquifex aeolicus (strain VF5) TaxID=224324 RepID=FLID_AQUAE|nr:flagellar filament capping protein FliD [Aquifex aeolicus]O67805.1 RecName: Full=Flagellar hook-associated protein 2; Short=HAP2; AltName: Full=Filament cap protein; AltName: Full=Flagellar cap protein [Aquifex aeolicus VF5]AAC07765.1 flagellar hook associated protein FliD [Aquifex aeolicus VF5]
MAGELYFSGVTGAYDWGSVLDNIMAVKSIPIQKLQQKKQLINQKLQILGEFSQKLSDLKNLIENFNLESALKTKKADVSDSDVISVSVSENAPEISFSVNVLNTASKEILVYDAGFNSLDETIGSDGSFTLRYYTSPTDYVEYTIDYSLIDTLKDIVNKINETQDYVKASIYYDGNKYKLMLAETSEENSTVETAPDLSTKAIHLLGTLPHQFGNNVLIQQAKNARIQIGSGDVIESAGNTFENVIEGVSISAKRAGTSEVSISQDFSKIREFLNNFVKSYNEVVSQVKSLTLGENAPFRGENTIMNVKYGLSDTLTPLMELGLIEYKEDGTISLSGNLESVINEKPDEFKLKMTQFLESAKAVAKVNYEAFEDFKEYLNDQAERIDENIRLLSQRLVQEEQILKRQFAQLEDFMNYANQIRERLKQFMVSISEMNGGNNK